MPDLALVKNVAETIPVNGPGVRFNAPPSVLMGPILRQIEAAVLDLPAGTNGAFLAVGDLSGVNGSVIVRAPYGFKVQAWVGKEWHGPVEGGVRVMATW